MSPGRRDAGPPPGEESRPRGAAGTGETSPLVVELLVHHRAYLDRLSRQIEAATGVLLVPADIVRTMVAALAEAAAVDPAAIRGERDLADLFHRRFTQQEDRRDHRERMRV